MKKILVILVMAVSLLLAPSLWSQNGVAPSETLVANIINAPSGVSTIAVTKNNQYVVFVRNSTVEQGQKLICYSSGMNKLWETNLASPYLSMSPYNCLVSSNTDNGVLTVGNDSLFVYNDSGSLTTAIKTPGEGRDNEGNKMIFKDNDHYYVVTFSNLYGEQLVSVYGNDLSLLKSFPINTNQGAVYGFVSENNGQFLYISSRQYGGGDSSNISSNLAKYTMSGDLVWNKHFPDCGNPKICKDKEGNILFFTILYFHTQTTMAWDIYKFSPDGSQVWEKMWLGDYAGDSTWLSMSAGDIISCQDGFIALGASTCTGQDPHGPNFDVNLYEAIAIGFNSSGSILWKTRISDSVEGAAFGQAKWDNEGYLIISGIFSFTSKLWKYHVPGVTAVTTENNNMPSSFTLSQNYPNPFNPTTTINFSLPKSGQVSLKIYDLLGREVATLVNDLLSAGEHKIEFNSSRYSISSGIYLYSLISSDFKCTKKMMLLK